MGTHQSCNYASPVVFWMTESTSAEQELATLCVRKICIIRELCRINLVYVRVQLVNIKPERASSINRSSTGFCNQINYG